MARTKKKEVTFKVNLDTEDLMQKLVNHDLANPTVLQLKRVSPTVKSPFYATKKAACFDLHAALDHVERLKGFDQYNEEINHLVVKDGKVELPAKSRVLVPTGFIFGIPDYHKFIIAPRSSTAFKKGIFKANSIAIIDYDYREESYLMLYNAADVPFVVTHNDRLCQGEIVPTFQVEFLEVEELEDTDSDRNGGVGSTGN